MAERTSWLAVEPGWEVTDCSGASIGRVTAVVGDPDADIFDGLRLETADAGERFVTADRVGEIVEGAVSIDGELGELGDPGEEAPGAPNLTRDRDSEL